MKKSEHHPAPAGLDYAAWIDHEGREHVITRGMIDGMIADLVSGPDYSLQGRAFGLPSRQRQVLTNSPPFG